MDLVEYRVPTDMLTSVALQLTEAPVATKVASPELVRGEAIDRIYDLVSSQDMYTVESIRKELGIRKELVSQYLTQMVEQGMLKPKEKGQKYEVNS
jgi:predicted transcriptional regulator